VIMARLILFLLCLSASVFVWAAEGGHMMHMDVDLSDQESLQRGARTFVNYCLSCHSAAYMRFNRLGRDLGITKDVLKSNLMFGTDKPGDTMTVAMKPDEAKQFFGVAPPDLSVVARARGADWLYTYFMTFYRDPSRPSGVNNLAFKDVAMPHVLWELQGWQRAVHAEGSGEDGAAVRKISHLELETPPGEKPAAYQGEDYEKTVKDLVNFLVYLGEPVKLKRFRIGAWVMFYLVILLIIVYFLKREYWKDVH
jgi:ubiquinol-cytochrome c reductase cytochrome c1 subunit